MTSIAEKQRKGVSCIRPIHPQHVYQRRRRPIRIESYGDGSVGLVFTPIRAEVAVLLAVSHPDRYRVRFGFRKRARYLVNYHRSIGSFEFVVIALQINLRAAVIVGEGDKNALRRDARGGKTGFADARNAFGIVHDDIYRDQRGFRLAVIEIDYYGVEFIVYAHCWRRPRAVT
jgi:hypothetical protein